MMLTIEEFLLAIAARTVFIVCVASHVVLYSQASLSRDSIRDLLYVTNLAELDVSIDC